jgi:hypothetical protein
VAPSIGCKGAPECNSSLSRLARCAPSIPRPHLPTFTLTYLQSNSLWPGGRLARAADCLLGICSQGSCCCSHKMKSALDPAAAPISSTFDCRVARGVGGLGLALGYLAVSPTSTHAHSSVASQHTSQKQSYASGPAAGMTRHGMRSTSKASCQPYQAIGQAT